MDRWRLAGWLGCVSLPSETLTPTSGFPATVAGLPIRQRGRSRASRRDASVPFWVREAHRRPRHTRRQCHRQVRAERVKRPQVDLIAEDGASREAATVAGREQALDWLADAHVGIERRDLLPLHAVRLLL